MKKTIITVAILIIIIVISVGLIVKFKFISKTDVVEEVPTPTVVLPTVSENIKVTLTPRDGNRAIILKISGLTADIETVEYELTYMTGNGLPRGVLGKITLKGEKEIIRDDIVLGTCSSGKCVYDTGVTSIDLSLKFTNSAGVSSIFRKTYPL